MIKMFTSMPVMAVKTYFQKSLNYKSLINIKKGKYNKLEFCFNNIK